MNFVQLFVATEKNTFLIYILLKKYFEFSSRFAVKKSFLLVHACRLITFGGNPLKIKKRQTHALNKNKTRLTLTTNV